LNSKRPAADLSKLHHQALVVTLLQRVVEAELHSLRLIRTDYTRRNLCQRRGPASTTVAAFQPSGRSIIGPGMSLEVVVMHHEEPQAKHGPSYSQDWSAYSPQCFPRDSPGQHGFLPPSSSMGEKMAMISVAKGQQSPTTLGNMQTQTTSNAAAQSQKQPAAPKPSPTKAKRVRTGCLTCRERHLKCDEAVPDCMNCRKRGRECKRGIRLNFLDINVYRPACVPPLEDWAGMRLFAI
jgi:hypothetical protein